METIIKNVVLVLALLAAPGLAPAAEASPSEKSPPQARVHGTAFAGYRPLTDDPMRSWRDANDEMGRLGGHMGHIGNEAGPSDRTVPGSVGTPAYPLPGNSDKAPAGAHSSHQR